jgi:flagellar biosynthesis protein FlhG
MPELQLDQASGLRRLGQQTPVKVIAVTGGKGGVGKTTVAVNIGTALCELGRRVMLLDADLGLANVDVVLGLRTRYNLEHVMSGDCSLADVMVTAPSGLKLVPASSGNVGMANMDRLQHAGLISAFSELFDPIDVLLVDTAAGIGESVVTFAEAAQRVAVVVCDEPASLTDAYGLIKVLCRRQPNCRIEVVANMVESPNHGRALYDKLARVTERFLGVVPSYFGTIPQDEYLRRAIQRQGTVVEHYPGSASARAFKKLAREADAWSMAAGSKGSMEFFVERLLDNGAVNRGNHRGSRLQ